ncbi:hypothetical protein ZWY2020_049825 [Hordeum vulgare]|nr:hypothetical protein ZWY2020_049825 [Hordeum vulgare]
MPPPPSPRDPPTHRHPHRPTPSHRPPPHPCPLLSTSSLLWLLLPLWPKPLGLLPPAGLLHLLLLQAPVAPPRRPPPPPGHPTRRPPSTTPATSAPPPGPAAGALPIPSADPGSPAGRAPPRRRLHLRGPLLTGALLTGSPSSAPSPPPHDEAQEMEVPVADDCYPDGAYYYVEAADDQE